MSRITWPILYVNCRAGLKWQSIPNVFWHSTRTQTAPHFHISLALYPIVYFLSPREDAYCEPPRRQDVWKTHTTTEVCLTDTYTGRKNYPLSSCDPNCVPSKNDTEMQAQRQRSYASSILRSASALTAVTSQRGTKGKGGQAWWKILMELWGPLGPDTSSLTRIAGNPHRKQFHTTGPQRFLPKTKSNQISASYNTTLTAPLKTQNPGQSMFIFSTQQPYNQAFCSKTNKEQTNEKKPSRQNEKQKVVITSMTANIVFTVNFNYLNQMGRKVPSACVVNLWPLTQCFKSVHQKTESSVIKKSKAIIPLFKKNKKDIQPNTLKKSKGAQNSISRTFWSHLLQMTHSTVMP